MYGRKTEPSHLQESCKRVVSLGHKKEGTGSRRLSTWEGELLLTVDPGYWKAQCKGFRSLNGIEDEAQIWQQVWNNIEIKAGWLLWQLR